MHHTGMLPKFIIVYYGTPFTKVLFITAQNEAYIGLELFLVIIIRNHVESAWPSTKIDIASHLIIKVSIFLFASGKHVREKYTHLNPTFI